MPPTSGGAFNSEKDPSGRGGRIAPLGIVVDPSSLVNEPPVMFPAPSNVAVPAWPIPSMDQEPLTSALE